MPDFRGPQNDLRAAKNPRARASCHFAALRLALPAFCSSSVSIFQALWAVLLRLRCVPHSIGKWGSTPLRFAPLRSAPFADGMLHTTPPCKTAQRALQIDTELPQNAFSAKLRSQNDTKLCSLWRPPGPSPLAPTGP